jgi:DNA-binding SARP family transcriptional activator
VLTARVFGEIEFFLNGQKLSIKGKPAALMALLCFGKQPRAQAERLLWGRDAAHNLRQAIYSVKKLPQSPDWFVSADPLELIAQTDLETINHDLAPETLLRLLELPLLAGMDELFSDEGLEWLALEREKINLLLRQKLFALARGQENPNLLEVLLRLDPLHESAAQILMRLYLAANTRDLALEVYGRLRTALQQELGSEPLPETSAILHGGAVLSAPERLRFERAHAVVGSLQPRLIAQMLERPELEVAEVLSGLNVDVAQVRAGTPDAVWKLLNRRAAELHPEAEQAAQHWLQAGEPEQAAQTWLRLAQAQWGITPDAARGHCHKALEVTHTPETTIQVWVLLRQIAEQKNDLTSLGEIATQLHTLAQYTQRDDAEYQAHVSKTSLLIRTGRAKDAFEPLQDAARAAKRLGQTAMLEQVQLLHGTALLMSGDLAGARDVLMPLLHAQTTHIRISANSNVGAIFGMQQQPEVALDYFEEALKLARLAGNLILSARIVFNIATSAEKLERFERAVVGWREAKQLAERLGDSATLSVAYGNLALSYVKLGALGLAWNTACELLELEVATGRFLALSALANVAQHLQDNSLAKHLWTLALELAMQQQNQRWIADVEFNLALLGSDQDTALVLLQDPKGLSAYSEACLMFGLQSNNPQQIRQILPEDRPMPRHHLMHQLVQLRLARLEQQPTDTSALERALKPMFLETPLGWGWLAEYQAEHGLDKRSALEQMAQTEQQQREGLPRDLRRSLTALTLD